MGNGQWWQRGGAGEAGPHPDWGAGRWAGPVGAAAAMPAVSKGDGMRGLAVFISDIRNCELAPPHQPRRPRPALPLWIRAGPRRPSSPPPPAPWDGKWLLAASV